MPYFYYDSYYLVLVLPAILISLIAQFMVQNTFKKYASVMSQRGKTAAEIARRILDDNGLHQVKIEQVSGHLSDHYDPRTNIIRLSDSVYSSSSVASIGATFSRTSRPYSV